jgi:multidrug resistance protein MdtO
VRLTLGDSLEEMARIVQRGGYPVEIVLELPPEASLSPLARELVAAMREAIKRFAESGDQGPAPAEKKEGFLAADAFTNPEHLHYALKTTAAAVFCYVLYSLLDWPGIHTCFLTVYIVAQSTAAESVEKLSLRLLGCLIGATAGMAAIVFLIPALTSIGGLMIAVFIGTWAAAYVAAGSPRISYAGFQIAFAFFLCIIQGSGPAFDLTVGRDRIIGIIIGNLVAYFAFVYVWPVSITRRVNPAISATFSRLAQVASAKDPAERRLLASQAQGALSEVETEIELAHYEPASIRSSAPWLASRQQLVENSQSLGSLLLLSDDTRELSRVSAAARLERLALRLAAASTEATVAPLPTVSAHGWQTLAARVDRRLRALEEAMTRGDENARANSHAAA